jgi:hypothetical protein
VNGDDIPVAEPGPEGGLKVPDAWPLVEPDALDDCSPVLEEGADIGKGRTMEEDRRGGRRSSLEHG